MPNPNDQAPRENRSSAPTPEVLAERTSAASAEIQALVGASVKAAVNEAVSGVFAQLGPLLKEMQITPEKLREANKPYKDPAAIARELREMMIWKEDEAEARRLVEERQNACPHLDSNGRSSVQLVHNFPDRQPRGICAKCHAYIHPREWRIGAPDAKHPRGVPFLIEPHRSYQVVMQLEAQN